MKKCLLTLCFFLGLSPFALAGTQEFKPIKLQVQLPAIREKIEQVKGCVVTTAGNFYNGAARTIGGIAGGINNYFAPQSPTRSQPANIQFYLNSFFIDGQEVRSGGKHGVIFKNGTVVLETFRGDALLGDQKFEEVNRGTVNGDKITMKNGDTGQLNRSAKAVVIGTDLYSLNKAQ